MKQEDIVKKYIEQKNGILKTSELKKAGVDTMILTRLTRKGVIERIARGLYIDSNTFEDSYYIFQYQCPKAIFSHETALYFHDLTDRTPIKIMATIPSGYNTKFIKDKNYLFSYLKQELYNLGKTKVKTPYGNEVYCYDIERTICDLIRDKRKIESYQFTDAIKRYAKLKDKDINRLYKYAEKFNIKEEVRKYMEVLV